MLFINPIQEGLQFRPKQGKQASDKQVQVIERK
jgi:hypothetical protein